MADLLSKIPKTYEPLKKNRFIVRFPADLGIMEWTVAQASLPHITQNVTEIQWMNTSTYVVGRYTWGDINITIHDLIGPSMSQAVMEWVRLHSESATGRQGYAAGYKRDIELELLDPTGVIVQKWILVNTWVSDANFGDVQYSDDGVKDITMTLRPDYCILAY